MTVTTSSGKAVSYEEVLFEGEWMIVMNNEYFLTQSTGNLVNIFTDSGIRVARGINRWDAIRDLAELAV